MLAEGGHNHVAGAAQRSPCKHWSLSSCPSCHSRDRRGVERDRICFDEARDADDETPDDLVEHSRWFVRNPHFAPSHSRGAFGLRLLRTFYRVQYARLPPNEK